MDLRKTFQSQNDNLFQERNISKSNNSEKERINKTINELATVKLKSKNIHDGHRSRLKEQFLSNKLDSMTDIQKLELLLFYAIPQKDTNPIAHNLLNEFGSLKEVFDADYNRLIRVNGIKENSALLINLVKDFAKYCNKPSSNQKIDSSESCINFAKKLFFGAKVEEFFVICLSYSGSIKKYVLINSGSIDMVNVQIRTITQIAIENGVNRIIIAHNHPEGSAEMSDADFSFTHHVVCSCILNSIDVLDHIIVGKNDAVSLYEGGIMDKVKNKAIASIKLKKETREFLESSAKNYTKSKEYTIEYPQTDNL